jgi:hypothetical protein
MKSRFLIRIVSAAIVATCLPVAAQNNSETPQHYYSSRRSWFSNAGNLPEQQAK